jgi:hypothetical protein
MQASAQLGSLSSLGSLGSLSSLLPILGIGSAPPAMPTYQQPPPAPAPNSQWTPGYWGYGQGGYSYVPGTWQQPPQQGAMWTPGYWNNSNGAYNWSPGYWGNQVGYYGGVNYGGGYPGTGFNGGSWTPQGFKYNTAVLPVNTNVIHSTYVDKTAYTPGGGASFNGPGGIATRETPEQLKIQNGHHYAIPEAQKQHIAESESDRNNLASVNKGKPRETNVDRPYSSKHPPKDYAPVTKSDRDVAAKDRKPQGNQKQNSAQGNKEKQNNPQGNKQKQNNPQGNKQKQNNPQAHNAQGNKEKQNNPQAHNAKGNKQKQNNPQAHNAQGSKEKQNNPQAHNAQGNKQKQNNPQAHNAQGNKEKQNNTQGKKEKQTANKPPA